MKRSLEDNVLMKNRKKRRHISPQHNNHKISSYSTRKKSKNRILLNNSSSKIKNNNQISHKSSSRRHSFSIEYLNEINLSNWERISPNIDQILSNKHTQSGVYAHEVHLIQQELEALLSMSIVRENILKDLLKPTIKINNENIRSKIVQHQNAENIYSLKKNSKKIFTTIN